MNEKRLLKLAAVLKTVPSKHFDMMACWVAGEDIESAQSFGAKGLGTPKTCGTTACAMGWACTVPEFKRAGLKMQGFEPHFKNACGFTAAEKFFDISENDAAFLFGAENEGITPKQEAARIIKFVETRKKIERVKKTVEKLESKKTAIVDEYERAEDALYRLESEIGQ